MGKSYLVLDYEFTFYKRPMGRPRGFFAEIIEIGAVLLDGASLGNRGQIQNFVKPHFFPKQAKDAMDFCMITDRDMKKAIPFAEMLSKLSALYRPGETYFVSWGGEDYRVLQEGCNRHKLQNPILAEDCLDLAEAYRLLKGNSNTTGLKKATEEENVDTGGLWHTAYDDAANTGKLLLKLLADGWTPEQFFEMRATAQEEHRLKLEAKQAAYEQNKDTIVNN